MSEPAPTSLAVGTLAQRCLSLLRPMARHVLALGIGFGVLALLFLPPVAGLLDLFWTRVLAGEPLPAWEARLFALDPAVFSDVNALGAEARHLLARRVVIYGACVALVLMPPGIALYYYQVWILQQLNQRLRLQLLDRLQAFSMRFHGSSSVGDAVYRLYQDSAAVTQLVQTLLLDPIALASRWLFSTAVVAAFDPWLALVLGLAWPPLLGLSLYATQKLRRTFRAAREAGASLTGRIQETLAGIRVLKAYGAEAIEQERFEAASRSAFDAAFAARSFFAWFQIVAFWLLGSAALLAISLAAVDTGRAAPLTVVVASFTAWNLGLFNFFKLRAGDAADSGRGLLKAWGRIQDVAVGLDRVFEFLDREPEVQDRPGARDLTPVRQGVRFRGVSFAWSAERGALVDLDLAAPIGSVTAIVGPTGSGKSTAMSLLLRLFDPDRGAIEIDGTDLRDLKLASLREHVAIALQENMLFGETVRENIRFAKPRASDEEVRSAARIACADEFIERLPAGYDTPLGERGAKLSSGQRQRLSIARAVLKDAPILILDEPTASLDAETEARVLRNLASWGRGRVIFLVTHRLSTIRLADRIAVLENGRLVEVGSHPELMERSGGVYRRLVQAESDPHSVRAAG